jgi:hypothetical protein
MTGDHVLMRKLLVKLTEKQATLQEGDRVLVQPRVEGMHVEYPLDVPGYDHDQIDFHLRLLCQLGLVDSGGVRGGPLIGIFFSRVTPAGQEWLRTAGLERQ